MAVRLLGKGREVLAGDLTIHHTDGPLLHTTGWKWLGHP